MSPSRPSLQALPSNNRYQIDRTLASFEDRHVVVSSVSKVDSILGPLEHNQSETMLFWADQDGKVIAWREIDVWVPADHEAGIQRAKEVVIHPALANDRVGTGRRGFVGELLDYFENYTPIDHPDLKEPE